MGQNLFTALEANKAWAAGGSMIPESERQLMQEQFDSLRKENAALREEKANQCGTIVRYQQENQHLQMQLDSVTESREIYRTSVNKSHNVLTFAGVSRLGCVAERIKCLLRKNRL